MISAPAIPYGVDLLALLSQDGGQSLRGQIGQQIE